MKLSGLDQMEYHQSTAEVIINFNFITYRDEKLGCDLTEQEKIAERKMVFKEK